ncbi:hypothetical protein DFS34DRAFT_697801 [Phlyctochytrium arcticum]|nr:hypothetical protein DFS34DRAFT_697801 [Phlyctochytrium arcticum]
MLPQFTDDNELGLLKNTRNNFTMITTTAQDREDIAEQRLEMMKIYVNTELKLKNYGIDVMQGIENIVANARSLSDKDFFYGLALHALSLRDQHNSFDIPGAHGCYNLQIPYQLQFIESQDIENDPKLAVASLPQDPELRAILPPQIFNINPGDELLSIDGKSFRNFYLSVQDMASGSNLFGGYRTAKDMLDNRACNKYPLPEKDEVELVFRSNQQNVSVKAPYISTATLNCLRKAPRPANESRTVQVPPPNPENANGFKAFLFPPENNFNLTFLPDGDLSFMTYVSNGFKLGYIRMPSFSAADADVLVEQFKAILVNGVADTDGLVVDTRNNGGGNAGVAEAIPQFFTSNKIVTTTVHMVVNPTTKQMIVDRNFLGPEQRAAFLETPANANLTSPIPFSLGLRPNMDGQMYFKPVAILNDAVCYSACETFSAVNQDNDAAIIFGEDGQTGGGGANVFFHSGIDQQAPGVLKRLPLEAPTGGRQRGNLSMALSFRAVIRSGKNNGVPIEDFGLDKIAERLKAESQERGLGKVNFSSPTDRRLIPSLVIPFISPGFDSFEVLDEEGQIVAQKNISDRDAPQTPQNISAPCSVPRGTARYTIIGYRGGRPAMQTKREISIIPPDAQIPTLTKGSSVKCAAGAPFVGIYNNQARGNGGQVLPRTSANKGFQITPEAITLRTAPGDTVDTNFACFVRIPADAQAKLSLDTSIQTNGGFPGSFRILARPLVSDGLFNLTADLNSLVSAPEETKEHKSFLSTWPTVPEDSAACTRLVSRIGTWEH